MDERTYLRTQQYGTAANLNARIELHHRFSTNPYPWHTWVLDHISAPDDAHILEVGCGPASLWRGHLARIPPTWNIVLADLSEGMIKEAMAHVGHDRRFSGVCADIQALPFEDDIRCKSVSRCTMVNRCSACTSSMCTATTILTLCTLPTSNHCWRISPRHLWDKACARMNGKPCTRFWKMN